MNMNNNNNIDQTISNNNNTDDDENDANKPKSLQQQPSSSLQQEQEHDDSTTVEHSTACGSINNNNNNNNNNNKDNDDDDDMTTKKDDNNNNDTTNKSDYNANDKNNNVIVDVTDSTTEYKEAVEVIMSLSSIDQEDGSCAATTTNNNNNKNNNNNDHMIFICYGTNDDGHVFEVQRYCIEQEIDPLYSFLHPSDENKITKTGDGETANKRRKIDFKGTSDETSSASLQIEDATTIDMTTTTTELGNIKNNTTTSQPNLDGQNETSSDTKKKGITNNNNNNKSWNNRHGYFDQFIQLDTLDVTEFPKWIRWYRNDNNNSSETSYSNNISGHIENRYQLFLKNRTSTNNNTNNNDYNDDHDNEKNSNITVNSWCTITKSKDKITSLDMLTTFVYQGLVRLYSIDYDTMNEIDAITQERRPIHRRVENWDFLPTTSPNYKEAVEYFYKSLGPDAVSHYKVTRIGMNFNPTLWRLYRAYLDGIQSRAANLPHNNNNNNNASGQQQQPDKPTNTNDNTISDESYEHERRWLFHGTKADNIVHILLYGFNRSLNRTYAYGQGTYFARDASLSCNDKFASPSIRNSNDRFVLMCRVVVGTYCLAEYPDAIIPPYKNYDCREMYNTTVDCINNSSIFVTYHDAQVYPEYLIRFQYIE